MVAALCMPLPKKPPKRLCTALLRLVMIGMGFAMTTWKDGTEVKRVRCGKHRPGFVPWCNQLFSSIDRGIHDNKFGLPFLREE
jgi:hypothetical protein